MQFYRQGDVGIKRVATLPTKAVKQLIEDRIILAHGEVTGHAHAIDAQEASLYFEGSRRYLEVCYSATLKHEEHGPITLEPGIYEVIQQQEYSPEAIRNVQD